MPHFQADFKNKTTYIQNGNDESVDVKGKNSFYDILQRMDEVSQFHIVKDDGTRYTVDLTDGHFEVNGVSFIIHDQHYTPRKMKLIYFKEMHQNFKVGGDEPYEIRVNRYFMGWECNENDKNTKVTIAIEGGI